MRTLRFNDVRAKVLKFILKWSLSSWIFPQCLGPYSLKWWSQLYGRILSDTVPLLPASSLSLHRSSDFQKNNLSWSLESDNHCPFQFSLPQLPVTRGAQSPPLWPFPWTDPLVLPYKCQPHDQFQFCQLSVANSVMSHWELCLKSCLFCLVPPDVSYEGKDLLWYVAWHPYPKVVPFQSTELENATKGFVYWWAKSFFIGHFAIYPERFGTMALICGQIHTERAKLFENEGAIVQRRNWDIL